MSDVVPSQCKLEQHCEINETGVSQNNSHKFRPLESRRGCIYRTNVHAWALL